MIDQVCLYSLPAAMRMLPAKMRSLEATALLLAIGLQESRFMHRRQRDGGPARGFWQFESAGVNGVLSHPDTQGHAANVLLTLRYRSASTLDVHTALEHNDTLAAAFARLLLWADPSVLPAADTPEKAWRIYLKTWRPGKPIRETWTGFYTEGWERATAGIRRNPESRKA